MDKKLEMFRTITDIKEILFRLMMEKLVESGEQITSTELMIIYTLQHKPGEWRAGDLAAALFLPMSTLTGIIDKMTTNGILLRERSENDRRIVLIKIDPRFIQRSRSYMSEMLKVMEKIEEEIGSESFNRLTVDLTRLEKVLKSMM